MPGITPNSHSEVKKGGENSRGSLVDEKLATPMAYRKAKGLCYKCGMKWGPNHKCSTSVSLHVVEELWQLAYGDEDPMTQSTEQDQGSGDDLMAISIQAVQGTKTSKTMRVLADVHGREAITLIDSGSSHNFTSEALASKWSQWSPLPQPMQVKVANGQILLCTHEIKGCLLWVGLFAFKITLRILPLKCYDVILGIDWLEEHSPMLINW